MADFDLTQVPALVAQRLDAVAADATTRGQQLFAQALEDQRTLLAALAGPASALATATATRVQQLAAGRPPQSAGAPANSTPEPEPDPANPAS